MPMPSQSSTEQAIDGYCAADVGKAQCPPDDGDGYCAMVCQDYNGEPGYCPEYTLGELNNCRKLCNTAWGIAHCTDTCYPATFHYCILGQRP